MTSFRLDGKIAVVTGAASGIGQAIALTFAANGATLRVVDLNGEQAEHTATSMSPRRVET